MEMSARPSKNMEPQNQEVGRVLQTLIRYKLALLSMLLLVTVGCTTEAAKKAMNKPSSEDSYTGFDQNSGEKSKRKAEKLEPVKEDTDPEKAVATLVERMQKPEPSIAIPAEEQLKFWGTKQGVDKIVVSQVRLLLKHPKVEVRAPALRLTIQFGGGDANGDLIECLADNEYSIRESAFKALRSRTRRDFGYSPTGGEVARAKSVDEWRQWWQGEQRRVAVQPPSTYETNPPSEPRTVKPSKNSDKSRADDKNDGKM
jgi:hypothetical protein